MSRAVESDPVPIAVPKITIQAHEHFGFVTSSVPQVDRDGVTMGKNARVADWFRAIAAQKPGRRKLETRDINLGFLALFDLDRVLYPCCLHHRDKLLILRGPPLVAQPRQLCLDFCKAIPGDVDLDRSILDNRLDFPHIADIGNRGESFPEILREKVGVKNSCHSSASVVDCGHPFTLQSFALDGVQECI